MTANTIDTIGAIRVPEYMRLDRFEPISQQQFTRALLLASAQLALCADEISGIALGRMCAAELWALIHQGMYDSVD